MSKYIVAVLCALVVIAMASVASALDVGVSSSDVRISSREAQVYVWATNPTDKEVILTFNAQLGVLQGSFDTSSMGVAPRSTEGTILRINAPDCTRGVQDVKIEARITAGNYNDSGTVFVRVNAVANDACDKYREAAISREAYPYVARRDQSTVAYGSYFDPSEYNLDIKVPELKYAVGKASKADIVFMNRGAAGTFDVRLVGDAASIGAAIYPKGITLQGSEIAEVALYAAPKQTGETRLVMQVLKDGAIIAERDLYIEATSPRLEAPKTSVSETNGIVNQGVVKVVAKVKNPYNVAISNITAEVTGLPAGWSASVTVPSEIPANGEANVTAEVKGNAGEEARNATLVVKSNGQVIAEQKLPVLTIQPGMLTGFFTLGIGRNMLWIIVIVAVAAAAAYAYSKAGGEMPELRMPSFSIGSWFSGETAYKKRLAKIRAQIQGVERIEVPKAE